METNHHSFSVIGKPMQYKYSGVDTAYRQHHIPSVFACELQRMVGPTVDQQIGWTPRLCYGRSASHRTHASLLRATSQRGRQQPRGLTCRTHQSLLAKVARFFVTWRPMAPRKAARTSHNLLHRVSALPPYRFCWSCVEYAASFVLKASMKAKRGLHR